MTPAHDGRPAGAEPAWGALTDAALSLVAMLAGRGLTLATCESLTGGLAGAMITAVPGSSAVFRGGLVTYAAELKPALVGVDADEIARHGVVTELVARQMAAGARRVTGSDVAVSCTGVAGPGSQDGVPAGTVWIACAVSSASSGEAEVYARLLGLPGSRQDVREQTVLEMIALARYALEG